MTEMSSSSAQPRAPRRLEATGATAGVCLSRRETSGRSLHGAETLMHILHTVKKRGWSGETNSLLMLGMGQAARGHRVTIAASATSATAERARQAGLEVLAVSFDR